VPNKISDKQRELLKEFDRLNGEGTYPRLKSFFEKLKGFRPR